MTQQRPDERRAAELSRLMAAYEKDILKLCCLYLRDAGMAEDAAQETFFKAYRALDRFRGECADQDLAGAHRRKYLQGHAPRGVVSLRGPARDAGPPAGTRHARRRQTASI